MSVKRNENEWKYFEMLSKEDKSAASGKQAHAKS